ncbi:MAG: DinB family protein [Acidobacteriota bacterium]
MLRRPTPDEYAPFYATYVDAVPSGRSEDGDILERLAAQGERTTALLRGLSPEHETFRYAADKWSLRELVGHMTDTEWVFVSRALAFARRDPAPRPGMDQDLWAQASNANQQPMAELVAAQSALRTATVALFRTFDDDTWNRSGIASGSECSARAIPYIIAGHELHHLRVIEERYLAHS